MTGRFRARALASRGAVRETGPVAESPWSMGGGTGAERSRRAVLHGIRAARGRQRIPVRVQAQVSDCGPTSLQMVLAYHGIDVGIEELRQQTNTGRDGVSARVLLEAGRRFGMPARAVRTTLDGLRRLPPATVLFWNFSHFVVLERATSDFVYIVDPALGRRRVSRDTADRSFTGVALEFQAPVAADGSRIPAKRSAGRARAGHWRYLRFFLPRTRAWIPLSVTSLVLLLFNFAMPFASAYVIDRTTSGTSGVGVPVMMLVVLLLVASFLVLQVVRNVAILSLQTVADRRVTLGVLHHLLALPYEYFVRRNPGDLRLRVRTSTAVRQVLTNSALSAVFDGLLVVVYLGLLATVDVQLALVVIAMGGLQVSLLFAGWRRQEYLTADALEAQAQAEAELDELLEGAMTLKAAGLEGMAGERWSHTFTEEVNTRIHARRHLALMTALSTSLQFAAPLAVLVLGTVQVSRAHASLGSVIAFASLAMGLFVPLASLVQTGLQVSSLGPTLARLSDILETEPEQRAAPVASGGLCGDVELSGVHFGYPGADAMALHGVDLRVAAGEFVAVVGRSGCGKTTLAAMLAGLYLPTRGTVLVDGIATADLDRVALRRQVSFVNQDTRLFAGSIRDNIVLSAPGASQDDVAAAAEAAQIHADIMAMPMKFETLLGPAGAGLSGGQRQRIALARALVRRPRLLILDEATSALDPQTEQRIFTNLLQLNCTLVVIAHRLSTLADAQQIVVLERGRVVQRGRHADLLTEVGPYRGLIGVRG
ncbi:MULTISPECIES: peptidase domain-containing ABC transporter [unclassified Kitasatospora]|uniref:peptidase domain-containing ABC transporter n=1 Tax=unclassified Kitasatospora TaxID=2633591 RepID=UPI0024764806|nr:peptidase domain-containing ABC transporter [Kitasatospora sp. MAP12-44]